MRMLPPLYRLKLAAFQSLLMVAVFRVAPPLFVGQILLASEASNVDSLSSPLAEDIAHYYDDFTSRRDGNHKVEDVNSLAVHRWLGKDNSTTHDSDFIPEAVRTFLSKTRHRGSLFTPTLAVEGAQRPAPQEDIEQLRGGHETTLYSVFVLNGGCGLSVGLSHFEKYEPAWDMRGAMISTARDQFITSQLPRHTSQVNLRSLDTFAEDETFDVIYAIESLVHSPDLLATLRHWACHLDKDGIVVIIDDFIRDSVSFLQLNDDADHQGFRESWILPSLMPVGRFTEVAKGADFEVVENRDIGVECDVFRMNSHGIKPDGPPVVNEDQKDHQAWQHTVFRRRAIVDGKVAYRKLVLRRPPGSATTCNGALPLPGIAASAITKPRKPQFQGHKSETRGLRLLKIVLDATTVVMPILTYLSPASLFLFTIRARYRAMAVPDPMERHGHANTIINMPPLRFVSQAAQCFLWGVFADGTENGLVVALPSWVGFALGMLYMGLYPWLSSSICIRVNTSTRAHEEEDKPHQDILVNGQDDQALGDHDTFRSGSSVPTEPSSGSSAIFSEVDFSWPNTRRQYLAQCAVCAVLCISTLGIVTMLAMSSFSSSSARSSSVGFAYDIIGYVACFCGILMQIHPLFVLRTCWKARDPRPMGSLLMNVITMTGTLSFLVQGIFFLKKTQIVLSNALGALGMCLGLTVRMRIWVSRRSEHV